MYLDFYGLKEHPFKTTPDPKFLFRTPSHREALAQLSYGVNQRKGFIALTGEVGTGKTTLLHALMERLDQNTAVALIFKSTLPFDAVVDYMLEDFRIATPANTEAQRLVALNNFLLERYSMGQNTVLILDEAQNLEPKTLEEIRLLSNFETPSEKLLQILLVGQPELRTKLNLPELRQLRQRIALSCGLRPLTVSETRDCIRTRLRIAGAQDLGVFADRAVMRIAQYTAGIPRLINILCDQCLVIGFADQQRRIGRHIVEQAIESLEDGVLSRRRSWALGRRVRLTPVRWSLTVFVGLLLGAAVSLAARSDSAHLFELVRSARALLW